MNLRDVTGKLKVSGEKALVAFLTAGYPDDVTFTDLFRAAADAGCDVIEIGIPFSDPIADGPLIQQSSQQALEGGMSLAKSLRLATDLAVDTSVPIVFMSYYNPILQMGGERFAGLAADAGVCGVIIPDMSFEETADVRTVFADKNLVYLDLVAPTSSAERIERIAQLADGFLYLVSVTGVTGVHSPQADDLKTFVGRVRERTDLPLYVGFGITGAEKARAAARVADGVIIGSALIRLIQDAASREEAVSAVGRFLSDVKKAIVNPFDETHSIEKQGGV